MPSSRSAALRVTPEARGAGSEPDGAIPVALFPIEGDDYG